MELGSLSTQWLPCIGLAASCSFPLFLCSYVNKTRADTVSVNFSYRK
ncbi:hypothetical protein E2C01_080477 [Portunus trituberculatus]|uniref:Uncharacterized protein n=1 Tax=Portunus trituberculatus TaxID=210409 RepID=A0A5B7ITK9_PORTR|nr:hypothetical protein [Portunus trituberculatus]